MGYVGRLCTNQHFLASFSAGLPALSSPPLPSQIRLDSYIWSLLVLKNQ